MRRHLSVKELYTALVRSGLLGALLKPATLRALPLLYRHGLGRHALHALYAAAAPDKVALRTGDGALSYRQLWLRTRKVADALCRLGLGPGSGVTLLLGNRAEFIEVQAAASLAGLRLTLASTRSSPGELSYLVADSRSQVLIFESALHEVARAAGIGLANSVAVGGGVADARCYEDLVAAGSDSCRHLPARAGSPKLVQYTAGTTGRPKGAVREERSGSLPALLGFLSLVPMRHHDVHLVACPLYHSHGSGLATVSITLGGTVCLLQKFSPVGFARAVQEWGVTSTALVPTMMSDILGGCDKKSLRRALRSLRCVVSSGAPLPPALRRRWSEALGCDNVYDAYGATELGWVTVATPRDARQRPTTIGRAVPGIEVAVLDERGERCPAGRVGEIFARSGLLFRGYHGLPHRPPGPRWEGYCSAGDLGREDEEGFYYLSGRKHEMIISGGVNVYPAEVESILLSHPGVDEAAVIGIADARWGERVCAALVLNSGRTTVQEIVSFCRSRLGAPKVPKTILVVDSLPRTETGKVVKAGLKDLFRRSSQSSGEVHGLERQAAR